jgi:hypothetical protein
MANHKCFEHADERIAQVLLRYRLRVHFATGAEDQGFSSAVEEDIGVAHVILSQEMIDILNVFDSLEVTSGKPFDDFSA